MLTTMFWIYVSIYAIHVLFFIIEFNGAFDRHISDEYVNTHQKAMLKKPHLVLVAFFIPIFVITDVSINIITFFKNITSLNKEKHDTSDRSSH